MSKALLKKEMKGSWKLLLLFAAVLSLYMAVIIGMFDPKLGETLNLMAKTMPQLFAAFHMSDPGSTLLDFICNYMYGFLLIAFPIVFILLMVNRLIVRYEERGALAYLLATPNSRKKIIFTQAAVIFINLVLLSIWLVILSVGAGQYFFPGKLDVPGLILAQAGCLGLWVFLAGVSFFSACVFSESRLSNGVGTGLCIVFILLQMLSQVGQELEKLKYATPMTLFMPRELAAGDSQAYVCMAALYVGGILLFGAGIWRFNRKDLFI